MHRLAFDVGGTFTDIILLHPDGRMARNKVLSTPADYSQGIVEGVRALLRFEGVAAGAVGDVRHATTVATNAVLQRSGPRTGLLTTGGFRDVLEIGRARRSNFYDIQWDKPEPLVPRYLRREVRERIDARGEVVQPLDTEAAAREISGLVAEGAKSIAIALLNSYANPAHERRLRELAADIAPGLFVSASADLSPEIREYERTSTTVLNAYLVPVVTGYLENLERSLREALGITATVMIMQSNGGLVHASTARTQPVRIIESGPAAGALATTFLSQALGEPSLIAFDMGGTTAKACLIEDGEATESPEYEVGGEMSRASWVTRGSGYTIRVPALDIAEVGAGGGSIAWVDAAGGLHVGPRSAGASPGPACYGLGGTEPTVTDAGVALGYLSPVTLAGGSLTLDRSRAEAAIRTHVADRLGQDLLTAAHGIFSVANSNMIRAIRAVSTERGRDPRRFALVAFGGAGPLHAASVAEALGMPRVLVPIAPGLFSALGLLLADVRKDRVRTSLQAVADARAEKLVAEFEELGREVVAELRADGVDEGQVVVEWFCDLRYRRQASQLTVPVPSDDHGRVSLDALAERFEQEHERTYGHRGRGEPVEIVSLRVKARGVIPGVTYAGLAKRNRPASRSERESREVFFGASVGTRRIEVVRDRMWVTEPRQGPFVIEEPDTTILVPPGATAACDEIGTVIITLGRPDAGARGAAS